jgi:hypothetical protein
VTPDRSEATVLAELREVERYLIEAPPHSGHGAREALQARRDRLQRELRELRAGDDRG